MERDSQPGTGFSPSVTSCSKEHRLAPKPKMPLQITTRTPKTSALKFELLPLHSPLLRQSLLVSFPPLIDMLKFSGYPYLIRAQPIGFGAETLRVSGAPGSPSTRNVITTSGAPSGPADRRFERRKKPLTAFASARTPAVLLREAPGGERFH
jgi:hypothetical protein